MFCVIRLRKLLLVGLASTIVLLWCAVGTAQVVHPHPNLPAFSGAEGFGARSLGGRGGQIIRVTNLNDSGPGSYRAALQASGPRIVVFDVSGTIQLQSQVTIQNPYITIAGQTAPGMGITIAGATTRLGEPGVVVPNLHDVVIRHMRFRRGISDTCGSSPGDIGDCGKGDGDALGGSQSVLGRVIIDHVSASWGSDETMSLQRNMLNGINLQTNEGTIQWSTFAETLDDHNHSFGSTNGGKGLSLHHNAWISNAGRNTSLSHTNLVDIRNNIFFNWQHRTTDGGGAGGRVNMINNYYKPGPATNSGQLQYRIAAPEGGSYYVEGNHVVGNATVTADNWAGGMQGSGYTRSFTEWTEDLRALGSNDWFGWQVTALEKPIFTQSAVDSYQAVLDGVGASLFRDAVDIRLINSIVTGIATAGPNNNGIIHNINQVGGWPDIPFEQRPANWDSDNDGMPNYWEVAHGLNPNNPADGNGDFVGGSFTNVEHYLNEIGAFKAVGDIVWQGGHSNRYAQIQNWHVWFQPSRFDAAQINNGTVVVDAVGQHVGLLKIGHNAGDNATVEITDGWLQAHEGVVVGFDDGATAHLNLSGGKLSTPVLTKGDGGSFAFTGGELNVALVTFDLVNDGGRLAPGNTIHTLDPNGGSTIGQTDVIGNLALNGGVVEIELASAVDFDKIAVLGDVQYGGTLQLNLLGGYVPTDGTSFDIIDWMGSQSEMFELVMLPDLGSELDWDLSLLDSEGVLSVVSTAAPGLAGDFNNDGIVDAADYTVWRNHLGEESEENINYLGDGQNGVDGADYLVWKQNYGMNGSGGLSTLVPEPASWILVWMSLVAVGCYRQRGISKRTSGARA